MRHPSTVIGVAAILLLAVPALVTDASARWGGGGGPGARSGGGGFGGRGGAPAIRSFGGPRMGGSGIRSLSGPRMGGAGIRSFSGPRMGGAGIRSFSGPRMGGAGVRSFSGHRLGGSKFRSVNAPRMGGSHIGRFNGGLNGRSASTMKLHHPAAGASRRFAGSSPHRLAGGAMSRHGFARVKAGFGHRAITNAAFHHSIKWAPRFGGKFHHIHHHHHWPWWRAGIVIGWVGPVFWPYAYYDFFDYVFWPYVYDDFWPYAYEDVYFGIYGPYSYVDPAVKSETVLSARAQAPARRVAGVCSDKVPELTNWPIERIAQVVEPTEPQHAALDEFKNASAQAIDILKAACPNDLPSIPTGRLAAMESRLQVMLSAVQTVRPPLDRFYESLSDEQKARFNATEAPNAPDAVRKDQRDLTRLCTERGAGIADLPIERIEQAVRPTDSQRALLEELRTASAQASEGLKGNCPAYQALTPTGRVQAMEQRFSAMLEAVRTVQPALTKFYDALSDEQKARFNTLGASRNGAA
jgi:hypothetical protein